MALRPGACILAMIAASTCAACTAPGPVAPPANAAADTAVADTAGDAGATPADAPQDAPAVDAPVSDGPSSHAVVQDPLQVCGPANGTCPAGCSPEKDPDCRPAAPGIGAPCQGGECPVCQRCGPAGTCVAIAINERDTSPPSQCETAEICDGRGHCARRQGADCQTAEECVTGHCSYNVCCDRACDGVCEDCRALTRPSPKGICMGVTAEPEPNTCPMPGICVKPGSCAKIDQHGESDVENYGEPLISRFAQTLTMGQQGRLVAVRLAASCLSDEQYLLEIRSATAAGPSDQVLSSQIFAGRVTLTDTVAQFIALATPIPVTPGQILAVVVGPNGTQPPCSVLRAGNFYPGGSYFSQDAAGIWHQLPQHDLLFSTYVMP